MQHFVHGQHHDHAHGPDCGHVAVRHDDHVDYVHDGHLHHVHDRHVDEHDFAFPGDLAGSACPPATAAHREPHEHGVNCGHEAVPHSGHIDYLVGDRMHRLHEDHCDDHGVLPVV